MLLSQFNGGLNTNIAPSHIAPNEATVCTNIDNSSVILKPIKGNTATAQNFGSDGAFTYFNGQWISGPLSTKFILFNNNLYYYKDGVLTKNNTLGEFVVGLDKPTDALTVTNLDEISVTLTQKTSGEVSDLLTDYYSYIVVYYDADGKYATVTDSISYSGTLGIRVAVTQGANITRSVVYRLYKNVYKYIGTLTSSGNVDDLVYDLSAESSLNPLSLTDPLDVRQYCYTYYRETDGAESAPNTFSEELGVANNNARITGFVEPTDTSVTHIRLYRIGGVLTSMTLVAELATTTTSYDDTEDDVNLAGEEILFTAGTIKPPANLNYLALYASTLFGVSGSKLWFSQSGLVELWSTFNYLELTEEITGLGATQNGLLVFTRNTTHILTGTSSANFVLHLLSDSQGCISNTTVQYAKNTLLWLSLDGVCASTGGDIQVITEQKLGKLNLEPISSSFYENQYYLFHSTGTLLVDFRFGVVFKDLDLIASGSYYSPEFDKLYYINPTDSGMYEFGTASTDVPYVYKTGRLFGQGLTVVKTYKNIYVSVEGTVNMTVYQGNLDGTITELITDKELTSGLNDIKLPDNSRRGYFIQVQFEGTGLVYEVEFKVEGRKNGR